RLSPIRPAEGGRARRPRWVALYPVMALRSTPLREIPNTVPPRADCDTGAAAKWVRSALFPFRIGSMPGHSGANHSDRSCSVEYHRPGQGRSARNFDPRPCPECARPVTTAREEHKAAARDATERKLPRFVFHLRPPAALLRAPVVSTARRQIGF